MFMRIVATRQIQGCFIGTTAVPIFSILVTSLATDVDYFSGLRDSEQLVHAWGDLWTVARTFHILLRVNLSFILFRHHL